MDQANRKSRPPEEKTPCGKTRTKPAGGGFAHGLAVALMLGVAACAEVPHWEKGGTSAEQRQRDRAECLAEAEALHPTITPDGSDIQRHGTPSTGGPLSPTYRQDFHDAFEACMSGRGYRYAPPLEAAPGPAQP